MSQLFYDGGIFAMTVITVLFVALLIAAWKAPRWVREIGHLALAFAGIMTLIPLHNAADAVMKAGDISPNLVWAGVKCLTVAPIYALIVYIVSLIIRIIQKPRV
ncbi:MAG: hypothetical protein K6A62_03445 [Bacteroidales bacterium]|nr:hypothetical protein [Bacteroidales bacterium]